MRQVELLSEGGERDEGGIGERGSCVVFRRVLHFRSYRRRCGAFCGTMRVVEVAIHTRMTRHLTLSMRAYLNSWVFELASQAMSRPSSYVSSISINWVAESVSGGMG